MPEWTFEEFKARQRFKAQFVEPIINNLRRVIMERIAAALEWAQYGDDGAQGRPVLPKYVKDFGSERGFVEDVSPVVMVLPSNTVLAAEDFIPQQHFIDIRPDIHKDFGLGVTGAIQSDLLTAEILIHIRALTHIVLSMTSADFIQDWPAWSQRPGGVLWELNSQDYDGIRKGDTAFKRSGRVTLEVKTVEA